MTDVDEEMESSEEPRKEFDYLLNRVLMVIRSATTARTAAFFWYNRDKQQLVLEAKITDAGEDFTDHRKLPIGSDVVSQIAKEGRPQILTDISPAAELDLLPYYRYKAGTLSFVGVPVYYKGNVVGVLCADSKEEDAYTDVTVGFFGHFTKLISGLVSSYTSKFDLQHSARLLEATQQFRASLAEGSMSTTDILGSLFDAVVRQMQVSTIGVCMYDRSKQAWTITDAQSVVASFNDLVGSPIDLNNSVVGEAIKNGEAVSMPANMDGVRVLASEHELLSGQFIAIPLRSAQRTHGALFIENHEGTMSAQDVSIAESLGDQAGQEIENLRTVERLESGAMLDADTGALNTDGFIMRVREEFARSTDYSISLSVCLIRIDRARATDATDGSVQRSLFKHVLDKVRQQVREYDVVARYDSDVVAVALVGYASQEAQFWTENLRRDVASSAINVDGKRLAATISVGVAESDPRENWQSVLEHATTALEISSRQQNKVTLYS
jgi:diguanylate cyclase (GGDEF)-like protein